MTLDLVLWVAYNVHVKIIKTNKGEKIMVDDEDFAFLHLHTWHVQRRNGKPICVKTNVKTGNRYKAIMMHRMILSAKEIDHKDGDVMNNTRKNLRSCTRSQNMWNRKSQNAGFKGVTKRGNKFRAQIQYLGKKIMVGTFSVEEDAARAYDEYAKKLFGEFARCNF